MLQIINIIIVIFKLIQVYDIVDATMANGRTEGWFSAKQIKFTLSLELNMTTYRWANTCETYYLTT